MVGRIWRERPREGKVVDLDQLPIGEEHLHQSSNKPTREVFFPLVQRPTSFEPPDSRQNFEGIPAKPGKFQGFFGENVPEFELRSSLHVQDEHARYCVDDIWVLASRGLRGRLQEQSCEHLLQTPPQTEQHSDVFRCCETMHPAVDRGEAREVLGDHA
eukprot:CAMPEP_0206579080 /NCGR_PEP_ID=MMETSP0325_2-20121206/32339_1 /ASSEMBLY_ACC=CAM_ASM_000347 /TAXON_ID=2866 /ORGANISM="Crypthecodinium cohnii, Strain Seligo" /LENGTH=157 /DNA_ID=CAMNT_0054084829 /DNA_START=458 /DNA_END=932 /DNA_ORIENTATION=-